MGLLETLGFKGKAEVTAQYAPAIMDSTYGMGMYSYNSGLSNYGYLHLPKGADNESQTHINQHGKLIQIRFACQQLLNH
jgi:hypothetical protein